MSNFDDFLSHKIQEHNNKTSKTGRLFFGKLLSMIGLKGKIDGGVTTRPRVHEFTKGDDITGEDRTN